MRICYINLTKYIPPRDEAYLAGLKENGAEIIECRDSSSSLKKFWIIFKKHRMLKNNYDFLVVGYTAHILVPFVKIISRKKIIFNALASLYEGIIMSRGQASPFSIKALYCWLVDFLAFHCADLSLVESEAQKQFLMKKFFLKNNKLFKSWTGVNDKVFFYDPSIKKLPVFTVLFRGGFLPESGIEYAVKAAKILKDEDIKFRIIGSGIMEKLAKKELAVFDSKNVEFITEKEKRLDRDQLRTMMQECHLSLGQLSEHDRLKRTIPHKAFESVAMKIPYLTARNKGVLELLKEDETCFCANPADPEDLAKKILELKNNPARTEEIADNAYLLYQKELRPYQLVKNLLDILQKFRQQRN